MSVASFSRELRRFLAASSLALCGYFGVQVVVMNLYLVRLGFGMEFIGLVNSLGLACTALAASPAGVLGRLRGSRWTFRFGMLVSCLGTALMPLVEFLPPAVFSPAFLCAAALLYSGGAFFAASSPPYMMEIASESKRAWLFSMRYAIQPAATIVGSLAAGALPGIFAAMIGAGLNGPLPYRLTLAVTPLLMAGAFLIMRGGGSAPGRNERPAETRAPVPAAPILLIGGLMIVGVLRSGGVWTVRSFGNVYMDGRLGTPVEIIAAVMAIGQILAIPAPLLMSFLREKLGQTATAAYTILAVGAGIAVFAVWPHWLGAALGFGLMTAAYMLSSCAIDLLQQELVPGEWRAVTAGVCMSANFLGSAAMVFAGGYLVKSLDFIGVFGIGAAAAGVSALLLRLFFGRKSGVA